MHDLVVVVVAVAVSPKRLEIERNNK